jgi:hypothetical protein
MRRFAWPFIGVASVALFVAVLYLGLTGCAVMPDTIAPEIEHMSHATQHEPFTNEPTHYGVEILQATAEWNVGRAYLRVSEGIALDKRNPYGEAYGDIYGPREQFTAAIGYKFKVPK